MSQDFVVSGKHLVKEYSGDGTPVRALNEVSLDIPRGSFVSVMGPSGSGKSTLLHILGALDRPTSGEVAIEGKALTEMKDKELSHLRRRRIGFVFQFFSLVPVLTAQENISLPAVIEGQKPRDYEKRVKALMARVGIAERSSHLPSELSGGEQQRVAIARALVLDPLILLADEPTGNLDSKTSIEILDLLRRLQSETGQTTVIVTHDAKAAAYGDWALYLQDGSISGRLDLPSYEGRGGDERAGLVLNWLQTVEA